MSAVGVCGTAQIVAGERAQHRMHSADPDPTTLDGHGRLGMDRRPEGHRAGLVRNFCAVFDYDL